MSEIRYVVRFFDEHEKYLYSIHCDQLILDELLNGAKEDGKKVKVVAYGSNDNSKEF